MPKVIFTPRNEEEKLWRVHDFVSDKETREALSKEMLLYCNGFIRMSKSVYYLTLPINKSNRRYVRSILYAFAILPRNNVDINKPVHFFHLRGAMTDSLERTKRTILKMWSERPFETNREDFKEQYEKVMQWDRIIRRDFMRTAWDLMCYQVLIVQKRNVSGGIMYYFKLTDFGKAIVKLHSNHHYIF